MFLPGSPCTCCGGGCKPCQFCAPACLKVTFSGFSHGTGNCNECDHFDDATFYVRRPPVSNVSVGVSASGESGTGATFGLVRVLANGAMQNMARRNDGSYYVTAVPVTSGGQNYVNPTLTFTGAGLIQCRPPAVTVAVANGVITGVTVTDGGEYWPSNSCGYSSISDIVCAVCPENVGKLLYATVALSASGVSFALVLRTPLAGWPWWSDSIILSGSRELEDEQGNPLSCEDVTLEPEHISPQYSCETNGSVKIESGDCEESSSSACDLPDQIQITLGGRDRAFGYGRQSFGAPPPGDPFDGQCGDYENVCRFTPGGAAVGPSLWRGSLIAGGTAILDREPGCGIVYSGFLPDAPSAGGPSGHIANVDCGGGLTNGGRFVAVAIAPTGLATSVAISAPTKGQPGLTASAEVTAVSGTGAIESVTVTDGGSGYAREIFERSQPTIAVSISGGTGSGATFAVTLTQNGTGEQATWSVSSVSVTNGGTGYTGTESVVFTPQNGAVGGGAFAQLIVDRVQPTVTASVSGGSGGSLSVTLAQGIDFSGQPHWYVEAVAVVNGGSGYSDEAQVTFAVTDGVEGWPASAVIATVRTQPEVTASIPATTGAGAVLTPILSAVGNVWTVSDATISSAGSGYSQWESILFETPDTIAAGNIGFGHISSVDSQGRITGVVIDYGGEYYRATGVIESVTVNDGGSYYKPGPIQSVQVLYGGEYYLEESTGEAEVDVPEVTFGSQIGLGATATATVNDTIGSPDFGRITAIQITNGGQNYQTGGLGWKISISGAGFHRDELLAAISSDPNDGTPLDPNEVCPALIEYVEPTATRTTSDACPLDLLSRTYNMFDNFVIFPNFFENNCGATYCITGYFSNRLTIVDYGGGDITCQLSPA